MTSNLGADLIRKSTQVGFGAKDSALDYNTIQEKIRGAIKKHFKLQLHKYLDYIAWYELNYSDIYQRAFRKLLKEIKK